MSYRVKRFLGRTLALVTLIVLLRFARQGSSAPKPVDTSKSGSEPPCSPSESNMKTNYILVDYQEVMIDKKRYLETFAWTSSKTIMHFQCIHPGTSTGRLRASFSFSPALVLKTFVEDVVAQGDPPIFASPERWSLIKSYLQYHRLPVPTNVVSDITVPS